MLWHSARLLEVFINIVRTNYFMDYQIDKVEQKGKTFTNQWWFIFGPIPAGWSSNSPRNESLSGSGDE